MNHNEATISATTIALAVTIHRHRRELIATHDHRGLGDARATLDSTSDKIDGPAAAVVSAVR
jgi:hypothetical protein